MKTRSLILLALLTGMATAAPAGTPAKAAAPDKFDTDVATPRATTPEAAAGTAYRAAKRAPADKQVTPEPMKPADVSALVPRDSARPAGTPERRDDHRFNARGVNCSLYPSRCG